MFTFNILSIRNTEKKKTKTKQKCYERNWNRMKTKQYKAVWEIEKMVLNYLAIAHSANCNFICLIHAIHSFKLVRCFLLRWVRWRMSHKSLALKRNAHRNNNNSSSNWFWWKAGCQRQWDKLNGKRYNEWSLYENYELLLSNVTKHEPKWPQIIRAYTTIEMWWACAPIVPIQLHFIRVH